MKKVLNTTRGSAGVGGVTTSAVTYFFFSRLLRIIGAQ
jgi:hypothetical protein